MATQGSAMAATIASARASTGRGSSPEPARFAASGIRYTAIPIATQIASFAATAAPAYAPEALLPNW